MAKLASWVRLLSRMLMSHTGERSGQAHEISERRITFTLGEIGGITVQHIHTFLMFEGRAEEAMTFYTSLFPDSEIRRILRYGPEGPGLEGGVIQAVFSLQGQEFMCIDRFSERFGWVADRFGVSWQLARSRH